MSKVDLNNLPTYAQGPRAKLGDGLLTFFCPGCKRQHHVYVDGTKKPHGWQWNGDLDALTLQPSILVTYNGPDAGVNGAPPAVCHSFVTDGRIQFLGDCTHSRVNETVDVPFLSENKV